MRVGIIGGGPRGFWAVEELLHQAGQHGVPVEVEVWEPGELGAGSAYGTGQPGHWRLNVTSSIIRTRRCSFDRWRLAGGEQPPLEPFPARSLVGEFFSEQWRELQVGLPAGCSVRHVPRRVDFLEPTASGWLVEGREYTEVLLATGHAPEWPGALPGAVGVYPATRLAQIPAGARVAVRGAALTFIDVALELSVGRGGQWEGSGYRRSGREPAVIFPFTRKGRFLEVKPEPGGPLSRLDSDEVVATGQAGVRLSRDLAELCEVLSQTSWQLLELAGQGHPEAVAREAIQAVLDGADGSGDPVADLRCSREVALGDRPPGAAWAVGEAWRRLYPAIVARTSFGGRVDMPGFADLAVRLERVGFGPPVVNATRLLQLIDAGLVDVSQLAGGPPEADVLVDAVLAPPGVVPGTLAAGLVERGLAQVGPGRGIAVERDGTVVGQSHLAVAGRDSEDVVLGPDTLSRTLHDVIPRWAMRVIQDNSERELPAGMAATVPLSGRLEPWAVDLLADPRRCRELVAEFSSPVNVLRPEPMLRNIGELVRAGQDAGVETRVFFARKANKALAFVDAVRDAGHGVDVAGEQELRQVLKRGMPGERIILSAAVKPDELLELAVAEGVSISVDSLPELHRISRIAARQGRQAQLAPRLAPDPANLPPTRFGERLSAWQAALAELPPAVAITGVHIHLHGYAARDRRTALGEAFALIDTARDAGQTPTFIDLGGGVPMSYLDDGQQWEDFQQARAAMNRGEIDAFTWKADPLNNTYPFHQSPTRGDWLGEVLNGSDTPDGPDIAGEFIRRGLRLHLEPGRSVLDGCGLILARVAFLKHRSDGVPLVGLEMNRTQCRTTSDDILVDPILVRSPEPTEEAGWGPGAEGFLVGAYCIEDEVIVRRRMHFPQGITPGDIIALPNTAGYFMHILESASHQIPLAHNVVLNNTTRGAVLDDIDRG